MPPSTPTIKLSSGYEMPQVGFGLWKVDNETCADTVYNAIKVGYRLFDGACDYGNEVECGLGVQRAISEGLVTRSDLFIVSKLWPVFTSPEHVGPACQRSLSDWGLDYFDLYLIHFPVSLAYVDPSVRYPPGWHLNGAGATGTPGAADFDDGIVLGKVPITATWAAMENLVDEGMARSIGVSNFQAQLLYSLLHSPDTRIRPATLQIEHHPYLVQQNLLNLCKAEGIAITAYSSFGPASFMEFSGFERAKSLVPLMEDGLIRELASKYGKKESQVLLRWATQRGLAVIPKTKRLGVMAENLDCCDGFEMEKGEIEAISAKDLGLKFNMPTNYFPTDKLWIFG